MDALRHSAPCACAMSYTSAFIGYMLAAAVFDTPAYPGTTGALSSAIFPVTPITGCEIPDRDHHRAGLTPVHTFSAIGNIRESLFLVHNQVVHHGQVFRLRPAAPDAPACFYTPRRNSCARADRRKISVLFPRQAAISAQTDVDETVCPGCCNLLRGLKRALKSAHHFQIKFSRRHRNCVIAGSIKIMRLKRPLFSVEAIVRMNPSRIRREKASIFGGKRDSGGHGAAVVIGHV